MNSCYPSEATVRYERDPKYAPPPPVHGYCEICGAELPGQEHILILHDRVDSEDVGDEKK